MGHTWDDAKELLAQALERPAAEREAFVRAHGTSPAVIEEVLALLREASTGRDTTLLPAVEPSADEPELAPGTRIGTYTIIDTIATGGMGRVYLARDLSLQRRVAIKSLRGPERPGPAARSVIHREARSAAQITNPHVATIHGFFEENGRSYIVMEYVDGEALSQVLRRGKLAISRVLEIGLQLAGGLAAAHAKNVVHRDLKPANIQLTADGAAKILDFGIASVKGTLATRTSGSGHPNTVEGFAGTPGYMSPEQWQCGRIDERSDIFSLGLVLYEMTTGKRALGSRPLTDKTPAIARADALDRKVPRALADVISRAVAIDPAQRFGSASELRESLERVQRQVATPWWQALVGTGLPAVGRVIGGVSLLVGLCIALGYISSTTFNFALGRLGWADDKPWNWLVWGARSLVSDTIVVVCLAAVFGLFVVLRNVLLPMSTSLRRWDQTLRTYLGRLAESSPGHVPILASWIILVLATILAVTWWTFSPYLDAMLSPMPGASDGQFALLGPDHLNSRYWLNLLLVVIAVAAIAAAVWIGRLRTASAPSSHRSLAVASWGIASLAIISSQIPNHFDIEEALMPRIEWNGQKCYVLGKRDTSTMLCCPARQKNDRHPVVPSQDIHLKESDVGYVYENFRR